MYNLNYAPTTLGVQSWREIISGSMRTKKVEYHCSKACGSMMKLTFIQMEFAMSKILDSGL
jgi:hypothetical protein